MIDMLSWQKKIADKGNADYIIHINCKLDKINFYDMNKKQKEIFPNVDELIAYLKTTLADIEEQ